MSDRVFAAACIVVCTVIIINIWALDVPIAYEPVGPKAFPVLLALLMTVCCVALLVQPERDISWPGAQLLAKSITLVVLLILYASLFELLGFPLATFAMVVVVSKLFGGRVLPSLVTGAATGILGYLLFDRLLQVSLPLGRIWS